MNKNGDPDKKADLADAGDYTISFEEATAPEPVTVIGITVVRLDDRFLVGTRGTGGPLAQRSEFPGGKVERGESALTCALRECLEETGLRVRPTGPATVRLWKYSFGKLELHFFPCEPCDPGVPPRVPFRWEPRETLRRMSWPEANEQVIEKLVRGEDLPFSEG
jgi:8-oxo-dGTP pyrophosphatase MutT (NUDIX family)